LQDHAPTFGPSGQVVAVRGNVVDVRFPAPLPPVRRELHTGRDGRVVLEVQSHLSAERVRTIALTATRGLARGMPVHDSGHGLQVRTTFGTCRAAMCCC